MWVETRLILRPLRPGKGWYVSYRHHGCAHRLSCRVSAVFRSLNTSCLLIIASSFLFILCFASLSWLYRCL